MFLLKIKADFWNPGPGQNRETNREYNWEFLLRLQFKFYSILKLPFEIYLC